MASVRLRRGWSRVFAVIAGVVFVAASVSGPVAGSDGRDHTPSSPAGVLIVGAGGGGSSLAAGRPVGRQPIAKLGHGPLYAIAAPLLVLAAPGAAVIDAGDCQLTPSLRHVGLNFRGRAPPEL